MNEFPMVHSLSIWWHDGWWHRRIPVVLFYQELKRVSLQTTTGLRSSHPSCMMMKPSTADFQMYCSFKNSDGSFFLPTMIFVHRLTFPCTTSVNFSTAKEPPAANFEMYGTTSVSPCTAQAPPSADSQMHSHGVLLHGGRTTCHQHLRLVLLQAANDLHSTLGLAVYDLGISSH